MSTQTTHEIPLEWLVCPVTKRALKPQGNSLVSEFGNYDKSKGAWNFIPRNLNELDQPIWKTWDHLQKNGVTSYENSPTNNLGVGPRQDYIAFGEFCEFKGMVLDVGVGPQKMPSHVKYVSGRDFKFVGVDPLLGEQPRDFYFVQALGEYLPFKDKLFDQVVYATSLDHFVNPVTALIESKRVLKDDGEILIWVGEKDKNAPKPKESPDWYKSLQVPAGAEDPFHFKRFNIQELLTYFKEAGLKVKTEKVIPVDEWRTNFYFKVSKA
jgi:SAM-dependent methyltransferase